MIRVHFGPTPNLAKISLSREGTGLPYVLLPVDTNMGEQHTPGYRAINPIAKVPAIVAMLPSAAIIVQPLLGPGAATAISRSCPPWFRSTRCLSSARYCRRPMRVRHRHCLGTLSLRRRRSHVLYRTFRKPDGDARDPLLFSPHA